MEQIKRPIVKEYLPLKLYLNNLRAIQTILSEADDFSITIGDIKYNSTEELAENLKNKIFYAAEINTRKPYLNIDLSKFNSRLFVSSDEPLEAGLFYKLDTLLRGTRRKPAFMYSYYWIWGLIALSLVSSNVSKNYITSFVIPISCFSWSSWILYVRMFRWNEIKIYERHEKPRFLTRTARSVGSQCD